MAMMGAILGAMVGAALAGVDIRAGKTCLDPGMGPCPVGTVANGTCAPSSYHGTDCDTHASGYFSGVASLAACEAKVKPCKMGNYISYGADKSCNWASQCDFKHLCVDCSKDTGPNCPAKVPGQPMCPYYIAFTSKVLKFAPPLPPSPSPPPPAPDGCFAVEHKDYKYAPGNLFPTTTTFPHGMRPVDTVGQCCDLCKSFKNCSFWTYENGGTAAKPHCYQYNQACCLLKTEAAAGHSSHVSGGSTSGSKKPIVLPTCRDGTNCGGTNLWTTWHDTTLPNATSANPGTMPYPKSKDLSGWKFKSGCNPGYGSGKAYGFTKASADTWLSSWAADGNLYTVWGDGNVLDDITGSSARGASCGLPPNFQVHHGEAAIVGDDPFSLTITKVKSYSPPGYSAYPYGVRTPTGSLVYKGTWFISTYFTPAYGYGPYPQSEKLVGGLLGPLADFRYSTDLGDSWVEPLLNATGPADNLFGEVGDPLLKPEGPARVKFGSPHFVDFGQELEHSPDGKAYIVGHGATSPTSTQMWMLGDQVYMARVTPTVAAINDKSQWEFYAGGHGAAAKWVAGDVGAAAPLVEFTNHTGGTTMTYFPGLKKYVMTICTCHHYPIMDGGDFDTWILESDDITGPWALVEYMKSFGPQAYLANFVSKFTDLKANTKDRTFESTMMYTANYDPHTHTPNPPNSGYHMNLQQSRFDLSESFAAKLEGMY